MRNQRSNKQIIFLVLLIGVVSTILSPLGDILAEGLVDELKVIFGEHYKLPVIFLSIFVTGFLYFISEGNFQTKKRKEDEGKDLVTIPRNIFVFGSTAVGKTVLINSLINYMGNIVGTLSPKIEDRIKFESKMKEIKSGVLPNRTQIGVIDELNALFRPDDKSMKRINISFLDLSGDNFYHFNESAETKNEYEQYFRKERTKFILLADFTNASNDDQLIAFFIENLEHFNRNLASDVLLVISKWDRAFQGSISANFVEHEMPKTYKFCKLNKISILPFSVGLIYVKDDWKEFMIYDKQKIKPIYEWLYENLIKEN